MKEAKFIEIEAEVRYWEDAEVNDVEDTDGELIPLKQGNLWKPIIELETGSVLNWPEGTVAKIHYKVCDAGEYWLCDDSMRRIAKWNGYYVPDDILCINDNGFGDYIIFNVNKDGLIIDWKPPKLYEEQWKIL